MNLNIIILSVLIIGFYFIFKHRIDDLETRITNLEIKMWRTQK